MWPVLPMIIMLLGTRAESAQQLPKPNVILEQREILRGLGDVQVDVDLDDVIKGNLSASTIQTGFELRLRQSGVAVDSRSANDLNLTVTAFIDKNNAGRETGLVVYSADLEMKTLVKLVDLDDRSRFTNAPVWRSHRFGIVGRAQLFEVRQTLDDMLSKFLNDYLAVNPPRR
jgi:hypothetical protein